MKFSYNWLKELSGTERSPEELAELLLTRAFEVEEVTKYEHGLDGVVVGKVLSCEPHPDADRLKVTQVEVSGSVVLSFLKIGDGKPLQIVCGAPNVAAGQKVLVSLPGAKLPNGAEIRETDIRGVKSRGMICAEDELGMGTNHEGIVVLPEDAEVGMPIAEVFGLDDHILDVKILPNRGTDALSHYGLAREIAALEGRAFPAENLFEKSLPEGIGSGEFEVSIDADEVCSVYAGLSFRLSDHPAGLPLPLRGRMLMLGHHPIHPAADIANYLMLLSGQPTHAFDAERLSGREIIVRFAKDGEKLVALDDREVALSKEDLVIADGNGPVAIAGVMGGKDSAVTKDTKRVFFEIANFDPKTVRRCRVRHGFSTDAAYLFEHAVDPSWPERLRGEAISYFAEYVGAECVGATGVFPAATKPREIAFPLSRIEGLLGIAISEDRVTGILQALSLEAEIINDELRVTVPSFRPDLEKEADVIEEIGRVYGYEHVDPVAPTLPVAAAPRNPGKVLERSIKEFLAHRGFDEIMTYSFYGEEMLRQSGVPESAHLELENPMNQNQRYLRAKLLPTVLGKAVENMTRTDRPRMFEFGSVYFVDGGAAKEEKRIAMAFTEKENAPGDAFFGLKGELERLFGSLRLKRAPSFKGTAEVSLLFHPGKTAKVMVGDANVGVIGEVHPALAKKFGTRKITIAELSFPALSALISGEIVMRPLPKFPYVMRDLSAVVPDSVTVAEVMVAISEAGGPLLREAEVFDVYHKDREKSVSLHLAFGADDRTITGEEGEGALRVVMKAIEEEFGPKIPL